MAGNQSAGSIVYEISADVEPLLHPFPAIRNKPPGSSRLSLAAPFPPQSSATFILQSPC
ncbi:hypothetical protein SMC08_001341 [Cronobacter sakazakii]|nr:hypothetical protein [Cronobacter sakazakii]